MSSLIVILILLPFLVSIGIVLRRRSAAPAPRWRALLAGAVAATALVAFGLDVAAGIPVLPLVVVLLPILLVALAAARRPWVLLLLALGWWAADWGVPLAGRWRWRQISGFESGEGRSDDPRLRVLYYTVGGDSRESLLFPLVASWRSDGSMSSLHVHVADGVEGTRFEIPRATISIDGRAAEPLWPRGMPAEDRTLRREEKGAYDVVDAPFPDVGELALVELDLLLHLPSGSRVHHVAIELRRTQSSSFGWGGGL